MQSIPTNLRDISAHRSLIIALVAWLYACALVAAFGFHHFSRTLNESYFSGTHHDIHGMETPPTTEIIF